MINIVLIVQLFVILCIIKKNNVKKHKIVVDHYLCFSIGYIYYAIFPIAILENNFMFDDVIYNKMKGMYSLIPLEKRMAYLIIVFIWYSAFIIGSYTRTIVFGKHRLFFKKKKDKISFKYSNNLFFIAVLLLGVFMLYLNRNSLLTGYASKYTSEYKGSLSAYVIMLFSMLLLYFFSYHNISLGNILKTKWGIAYIFFAVMLLSMGGRLYVMSNIMCLVIIYSLYIHSDGVSINKFILVGVILLLIVGSIGVIRSVGYAGVRVSNALFNLVQEPLYTSYPLVSYLENCRIDNWIAFPRVLLGAFINLVPRFMFPGKDYLIITVYDIQPKIQSPLGATHFFVSYNIDMGILLTVFFMFMIGNFMGYLRKKYEKNSIVCNVVYCMISSNLMFTFFRDGVMTSIVKNIFEYSFLVPVIVILINTYIAKRNNHLLS